MTQVVPSASWPNQFAKITLLSGFGGMLEFYDFILYILFSDQIQKVFFSNISSHALRNLILIAVFSVAYIVRPIGGVFFGYLGDRLGRKKTFSITITIMGICIFFMGIMPSYATLGISSTILFILLRIIQGLALGGELPGALVFVYESLTLRRGMAQGILFGLVFSGFLLGNLMSYLLHDWFGNIAWRVAFISGSLVAFLGYYLRCGLNETILFKKISHYEKFPLMTLLRYHRRELVAGFSIVFIIAFSGVIVSLYLNHYLVGILHDRQSLISKILMMVSLINVLLIFFSGWLSDKIHYRSILFFSGFGLMVLSIPSFYLMQQHSLFWLFSGVLLISIMPALACGTFMWLLNEVFPTNIRFSGVAVSYNLGFAVVGGLGPMVSEFLINTEGLTVLGPAMVGMSCSAIFLLGLLLSKKSGRENEKLNTSS